MDDLATMILIVVTMEIAVIAMIIGLAIGEERTIREYEEKAKEYGERE